MNEQIEKLLELQEIDAEIYGLNSEKEVKPRVLKEFEDEVQSFRDAFKEAEEKLKQLELERKNKEIDLDAKEQEIKKYQTQLYQVKTNKEYSSLEHEIESTKADNSVLEEEIIGLLDEIDKQKELVAGKKTELQQKEKQLQERKKEVELDIKQIEHEIHKLKANREQVSKDIDEELLEKYERVLKHRQGDAMASISNSACSGCFMNLPPQVENDVRLGKFITCPNCTRILYVEE